MGWQGARIEGWTEDGKANRLSDGTEVNEDWLL